MQGPDVLTHDDDIDVVGLFSALKRKWWVIFLVTSFACVGLFLVLSTIPSRYDSNARIIIEDNNNALNRAIDDRGNPQPAGRFDEEAIRSQVEVLYSDKIALKIINDLQLDKVSEFTGSSFLSSLGDLLAMDGDEQSETGSDGEFVGISSTQSKVLARFKKRLTIYPIEKSRAIVIEFWSNNPRIAFEVPNRIARDYVEIQEEKKKKATAEAKIWLDPVLDEYRQKLEEAEAEVAAFKANEDILRGGNNASLASQQLSEMSTELSRIRAERSSAEAKVASIRAALKSGASLDAIPEVIDSQLIQRLREREVALRAQISDLSTTLLPNHPRLRALNSQVDDFQKQIRGAANNILKSLENNVNLTREREADLSEEISGLKEELTRVNKEEVKLDALIRKADSFRDLLSEYEKRNLEAISRSNFTPIDAEIYPSSSVPMDPYFPKVVPFTIAGTVAALALSILAVLAGSLISSLGAGRAQQVHRYAEPHAEELLEASPDAAEIVDEETANTEAEIDANPSAFTELETMMRGREAQDAHAAEHILKETAAKGVASAEQEPKKPELIAVRYAASVLSDMGEGRVVVTSPGGDAGSRSAWILARMLAKDENSVVVIDLSGGGATAVEMLGGNDLPGIFNLISGAVPASNVIYRDQKSKVHVVPTGSQFGGYPVPDAMVLAEVVDAIALSYDFCIVDCGDADLAEIEVVATDETVVVISNVDADQKESKSLEARLKADGFRDILQIMPDKTDHEQQLAKLIA